LSGEELARQAGLLTGFYHPKEKEIFMEMKRAVEKVGQLLNYEKLSNIHLLELPKIEKRDVPQFIHCPKYEKAKAKIDQSMERYRSKVDRISADIRQLESNIEDMEREQRRWASKASTFLLDRTDARAVEKQNHAADMANGLLDKISYANEKRNDLIDKHTEAEEEAKEKLEELTLESLQVIDEDVAMVINRCESVVNNLAGSEDSVDLITAIDICLIELRIYAMFEGLIEDGSVRKDCRECIAKVNQIFATLCANENVQNYIVDLYRRNLDLVQTNAGICQQISEVLDSVDQGQLDTLTHSVNVVLSEKIDAKFSYCDIIDPAEIDVVVAKIKQAINALNQNIVKAKEAEVVAVDYANIGIYVNQQAETFRASMHSNVEVFEEPLTQNHIALQMIEEAVIDDFYQKDLRVAATALRKHIIGAIGEESFENILKGGDDRFSLRKAYDAINKANLIRLRVALDKVPDYVKKLTEQISKAYSDIQNANEVPKENADALNVELSKKYIHACFPVIGFISAFGILGRVKAFESAFRSTNQVYRDLGNTLLEKNKKMITVIMIIGAILGFGGMVAFFVLNLGNGIAVNVGVPGAILLFYISTILGLTAVGKRLRFFLGIPGKLR
jgi:predicted  nucleic acid-binding Zn-ribbon protein